jgi:hypothetical protein
MKYHGPSNKLDIKRDLELHWIVIITVIAASMLMLLLAQLITFAMIPRQEASSLDMLSKEQADYARWDDAFAQPVLAYGIEQVIARDVAFAKAQQNHLIAHQPLQLERVVSGPNAPTPTITGFDNALLALAISPVPVVMQQLPPQGNQAKLVPQDVLPTSAVSQEAIDEEVQLVDEPDLLAEPSVVSVAIDLVPTSSDVIPAITEGMVLPTAVVSTEPSHVPSNQPTIAMPDDPQVPQLPNGPQKPSAVPPVQATATEEQIVVVTSAPTARPIVPTLAPATATQPPVTPIGPSPALTSKPTEPSTIVPTNRPITPTSMPATPTTIAPTTIAPTSTLVPPTDIPTIIQPTPTTDIPTITQPTPTMTATEIISDIPEATPDDPVDPLDVQGPDVLMSINPVSGPSMTAVVYSLEITNKDSSPLLLTAIVVDLSSISTFAGSHCVAPDSSPCYNLDGSSGGYWVWQNELTIPPDASVTFTIQGTYIALFEPPVGGQTITVPNLWVDYTLNDTDYIVELTELAPFVLLP